MKLFGSYFVKKDYATLRKLEKAFSKELNFYGYGLKKNDDVYIVYNDRADVGSISITVYSRSFDVVFRDAFGRKMFPTTSHYGVNWKPFITRTLNKAIPIYRASTIKNGYRINTKLNEILHEIGFF